MYSDDSSSLSSSFQRRLDIDLRILIRLSSKFSDDEDVSWTLVSVVLCSDMVVYDESGSCCLLGGHEMGGSCCENE